MRVVERLRIPFCSSCGGEHIKADCPQAKKNSGLPLETPSHNGPYRGTVPVRTVPAGSFGSDPSSSTDRIKAAKGSQKQVLSRLGTSVQCAMCRKIVTRDMAVESSFCSKKCRNADDRRRVKERRRAAVIAEPCLQCGGAKTKPDNLKQFGGRFCSQLCKSRWYNARRDRASEPRQAPTHRKTKWG